jgi:hypothetical protein
MNKVFKNLLDILIVLFVISLMAGGTFFFLSDGDIKNTPNLIVKRK